jgi:hypothetical protein
VIPGVSYVADIREKASGDSPLMIYQQANLILQIGDAISKSSRSGKMKMAAIISDKGKFVLDKFGDEAHLLTLKNEAEIGQIISEIEGG